MKYLGIGRALSISMQACVMPPSGKCLFAQNWGQIFRRWNSEKDTESNLGPLAGF